MSAWFKTEDWAAVWIGLLLCILALPVVAGVDLLGWAVATKEWLDLSKATAPVSTAYANLPGLASLVLSYLFLLVLMSVAAWVLGFRARAFALGFSVIFWISYACWLVGHNA
ncbi:MAG TPA: hypothetical protein VKU02_25785 [Gemmataceae bacterium]|nr:hypothetical protein [Gemmataceae bacterium]